MGLQWAFNGIFIECDMTQVWERQGSSNISTGNLKDDITTKLMGLLNLKWTNELRQMSSYDVYIHLKPDIKMEKYLLNLDNDLRRIVSGVITNNTRLPKVTGRYVKPRLEGHQRVCIWFSEGKVGDEYHLIFECMHEDVSRFRKNYVPITRTIDEVNPENGLTL